MTSNHRELVNSFSRAAARVLPALLFCLTPILWAQEAGPGKDAGSPDGTWKWTFSLSNGEKADVSLKLTHAGNKLSGTYTARNGRESAIEDGRFDQGELSFKVTRQRDGQPSVARYSGKVNGKLITGKISTEWAGEQREREWRASWEAPRKAREGIDGTWTWTVSRGSREFESTVRLKQDGEKVTGVYIARDSEIPIEEGRFKDGEVSFIVKREFGGRPFSVKHIGKLSGDRITGTTESPGRDGTSRTRDWEAKRADDDGKKKVSAAGTWRWTVALAGGQTFEPRVRLREDGDSLTGTFFWGENEVPVSAVKQDGEAISFRVDRERDGEKFTATYTGRIEGDTLKGTIDSNWGGQPRTLAWDAKRARR